MQSQEAEDRIDPLEESIRDWDENKAGRVSPGISFRHSGVFLVYSTSDDPEAADRVISEAFTRPALAISRSR